MTVRSAPLALLALAVSGIASAQGLEPWDVEEPEIVIPEGLLEAPKTELGDSKELEPALRRALGVRDGFCKNDAYELDSDERRLCDVAGAARDRCPGFARACERPRLGDRAADGASRGGRSRARGSERAGEREGAGFEAPAGPFGEILAAIVEVVFWALLVLGVGAMLYAAVTAFIGRRRERPGNDDGPGEASVAAVPRTLLVGSPEDLLARARRLAIDGDLKTATSIVLRALLRHLEIGGRLELHPSRTNGDYVRSLGRQGLDARELRRVAAEVEAVEFGGAQPSAEGFSALHAHVSKLVQAGVVVLALLALGSLTGCSERRPAEDAVNSCGTSASGYSVLCEALAARGVGVRRRFAKIESIAEDVARVVVLDDDLEDEERNVLLRWVEEREGVLVLLGRANAFGGIIPSGRVGCDGDGSLELERSRWNVPAHAPQRFRLPDARVFAATQGERVHARCGGAPFAVEATLGLGTVVAVADWRFATNASLAIDDNAALAASLVAPRGVTVELVGYWTGSGSELPVQALSRSGLLPWFLHVLALGFVFALYKGSPFGSRREPVAMTRRAFAEHAVALGDAYSRARASRLALANFGAYALERLRVRLQATKQGRLTDLAGAVAARHGVSEPEVVRLVVAVRSAEDQAHDSSTETEHLAALRRLAALVKQTGGSP